MSQTFQIEKIEDWQKVVDEILPNLKNNIFLAYPKNYNHFVNYYKDTYQHGGISLEEVIIPISILEPK